MQQWFNGLLTMDAQCWLIALAALSIGLLILVFVLVIRGKNDRASLTQTLTLAQEGLIQHAFAHGTQRSLEFAHQLSAR